MSDDLLERKNHHREDILQYINDNPQQFRDLYTPAERGGRPLGAQSRRRYSRVARTAQSAPGDAERAFGAGLYDGLTFGFGDELDAGWSALGAAFDEREMGDVYDADLARARAEAEYLAEQHSVAFNSGLVVGSVVQPLNYTGVGWAARGAGLLGRVGRAAAVGGANGGVHGFAGGQGSAGNRLNSAAEGALEGAAAGTALGPLLHGYKTGQEISVGKNFRIAPFGNRTGHPDGERPHYHRRVVGPNGKTLYGQSRDRHRPWEKKQTKNGEPEEWWKRY